MKSPNRCTSIRRTAQKPSASAKSSDPEAPRYDRQIRVMEWLLFSGGREWVCSRAREILEISGYGRAQQSTTESKDAKQRLAAKASGEKGIRSRRSSRSNEGSGSRSTISRRGSRCALKRSTEPSTMRTSLAAERCVSSCESRRRRRRGQSRLPAPPRKIAATRGRASAPRARFHDRSS